MARALGLDFGTTNTVLATRASSDEAARPISFDFESESIDALRSALCFWKGHRADANAVSMEVGPWAIDRFIEDPHDCRFIQSLKTFSASPHFQGTYIFAKRYRFDDLLRGFFERVRSHAGAALDRLPARIVIGRPVIFAGADPDPTLAMRRYREALSKFGFEDIHFVYEPVAAAFHFARRLRRDATILVADFGGGTTDYSIIRFDAGEGSVRARPLAHGGIGVAGDTFDYRIVNHVVLPYLGKGGLFKSMGKTLEIPNSMFAGFAKWNTLSVLKTTKEFTDIKRFARTCLEPWKIEKLIRIVDEDLGYPLYKAISGVKASLSSSDAADFSFPQIGDDCHMRVSRSEFESWIADDLGRMELALDATLRNAGLEDRSIDRVFLTGGTSFVPAVRRIFERRFGSGKIESGDELVSIANGLALIGERDDIAAWAV